MRVHDIIFISVFCFSLIVLSYFLGSSVTGYFAQSMYCEKGECMPLCRFTTECTGKDMICCSMGNFGVCEPSSQCTREYVIRPAADININDMMFENPAPSNSCNTWIVAAITLAVAGLGIFYLIGRKNQFFI